MESGGHDFFADDLVLERVAKAFADDRVDAVIAWGCYFVDRSNNKDKLPNQAVSSSPVLGKMTTDAYLMSIIEENQPSLLIFGEKSVRRYRGIGHLILSEELKWIEWLKKNLKGA